MQQLVCGNWGNLIGENNLGDVFVVFLVFVIIRYGSLGVLIIPKWLINDSLWIPILFG